jgi:tRNA/tmRNA/rRNA uracil-C5-methylase (TrmA/RlmC/RlmD family)
MVDLFCGNGFISLMFGDHFSKLYGYDLQFSSIEIIKKNLELNYKSKELYFEKKDLINSKNLDDLEFDEDSILFLDPPRNGIGEKMIQKINNARINQIFYISCNPISQLEDLKQFKEKFEVISGLLTDPFPHTPHLESVVYLKRID